LYVSADLFVGNTGYDPAQMPEDQVLIKGDIAPQLQLQKQAR
jgi:hypothetical protein